MRRVAYSPVDSLLNCKVFLFWRMAKGPFLFLGSCDLRDTRLHRERKEFGAVVSLVVFPHAEDSVQELPHDGDEGLHFGFAFGEQMLIEGAEMGIVTHGNEGGHRERGASGGCRPC